MTEKRVPYWEFMRQGYKDLKYPPTTRELETVVHQMQERIDETNKTIEELRSKTLQLETLLEMHGIRRD